MTSKSPQTNLTVAVKSLLQKNIVGTQEEICEALNKQGYDVNQVKISRLLHKLGAIKMTENGQTVYRLPAEFAGVKPSDSLQHLILNIQHNDSLIVIQTAPGSAQLVARLLDQKNELGILGTVAGDDTIFIAPIKSNQIELVFQKVTTLLQE